MNKYKIKLLIKDLGRLGTYTYLSHAFTHHRKFSKFFEVFSTVSFTNASIKWIYTKNHRPISGSKRFIKDIKLLNRIQPNPTRDDQPTKKPTGPRLKPKQIATIKIRTSNENTNRFQETKQSKPQKRN